MRPTRTAALAATLLIAAGVTAGHVSAQPSSEEPAPPTNPTAAAAPPAEGTPPPGPKTTIDADGTYAVGKDIVPGNYTSAGPNSRRARVLLEADGRRRARRQFAHQEARGGADFGGRHRVHDQRLPAMADDQRAAAPTTRQPGGNTGSARQAHPDQSVGPAAAISSTSRGSISRGPGSRSSGNRGANRALGAVGCSARPLTA